MSNRNARPILLAALCAGLCAPVAAQYPMVDISLQQGSSPDTLEVVLHPDGDFGGVVSVLFAFRHTTASGASLDVQNTLLRCMDGVGLVDLPPLEFGGFTYTPFYNVSVMLLSDACPTDVLQAGQPYWIAKIPVVNGVSCAGFEIADDAFSLANNIIYYISLGGVDRTGVITGSFPGGACGAVQGRVFQDVDGDCVFDTTDVPMPYRAIQVDPGGYVVLTGPDGAYSLFLPAGNYTMQQVNGAYVEAICPSTDPIPLALLADSTLVVDIADSVFIPFDLMSYGVMDLARPGFVSHYTLVIRNLSAEPSGLVEVVLTLDTSVSYLGSSSFPAVNGQLLTWIFSPLPPFGEHVIQLDGLVAADVALLGTDLVNTITTSASPVDVDLSNNTTTFGTTVVGSFDPNDKLVRTSSNTSSAHYVIGTDDWIEYTIRFQNVGSFYAQHVHVLDPLAPELDPATFTMLAASHPYTVQMLPDHQLSFSFINIVLPAEVIDEPGSHGHITFRVRPRQPLVPGTILTNAADIFFDYNPAIHTNDAELTTVVATGMVPHASTPKPSCFPDPARDHLFITGIGNGPWMASVLSVDGRTALALVLFDASSGVDVSALTPGVYLLRLLDPTGDQQVLRFVKE